jgi:hypothetical protein
MRKVATRWLIALLFVSVRGGAARAAAPTFSMEVETGAAWFTRNDARIPGAGGTRFSANDLTGTGPVPAVRLEAKGRKERHGWRLLYAPLSIEGTGMLAQPVSFAGSQFQAGVATRGQYRFDTYRFTYRYRLKDSPRDEWWVGFTGLVRDAEIALSQNGTLAKKHNIGFAPLLYLHGRRELAPTWNIIFDFDGLAAPQGRAFDAALKVNKQWSARWDASLGYRTLEGGSDSDTVYTFAWVHFLTASLGYRF